MRTWFIYSLVLISLMLLASAFADSRPLANSESCRSRADVLGKCFQVHGRLSVYNGTPSIRLWPIGSKRLLGIIDPTDTSNAPGPSVLPLDIKTKLDGDTDVFGDFIV